MSQHKILFFILRNLHLPHLFPIYRQIEQNSTAEFECMFSSAPLIESTAEMPGYGIENSILIDQGIPSEIVLSFEQIQDYAPDVIIMADADYRSGIDQIGAKIVNVNHGLISKGAFYTDAPLIERENIADLICVPGEFHREKLKRYVQKPVLVSGLTKFDPVWSGELQRDDILRGYGIDPGRKVVLYAPTFTPELSSVPMVTDSVAKWVDSEMQLLIKLHGMSPPEWVELYRLMADKHANISFIDEMDLTPAMVAADLMVSDVSSAFMEFAALDKPVVLINNPRRTSFVGFDPRDVEYAWRDIGVEADNPAEVPTLIKEELANPERLSEKRMTYSGRLVGPRDGKASERIVNGVREILR